MYRPPGAPRTVPTPPPTHLAVTALYTGHTWSWAHFPGAELLVDRHTRVAFALTNLVLRFARWLRPDAPSLPHSLAQRHQVIDHLTLGAPQLVELACGLSPRCLHRSADGRTACVEVDLPEVIAHKRARLQATDAGRAALHRPTLRLLAADARELAPAEVIDPSQPVALTAEGLLMYFEGQDRLDLTAHLATWLTHPDSRLIFDLTPAAEQPRPGRLGALLGWLLRRATAGHDIVHDGQDREQLRAELTSAGLQVEAIYDPHHPPPGVQLGWTDAPTWFVVWSCRAAPPAATT